MLINRGEAIQTIHQDVSEHGFHTDGAPLIQLTAHREDHAIGFRPQARAGIGLEKDRDAEAPFVDLPVCSTSLLFSQLRYMHMVICFRFIYLPQNISILFVTILLFGSIIFSMP